MKNYRSDFMITAHTGCENTIQNSIESIKTGAASGADVVEFDIRFDDNKHPVLSHDEPAGDEVSLDEAFSVVKAFDKLKVNLDIKCTDNLRSVQSLAKKHNLLHRVFYTGVFEKFVESVRNDSPEIPYYLNLSVSPESEQTDAYLEELVTKVKDCGAVGINLHKDGSSVRLCEVFRKHNLKVSVWTINNINEAEKIITHRPDNITTLFPTDIIELLNK